MVSLQLHEGAPHILRSVRPWPLSRQRIASNALDRVHLDLRISSTKIAGMRQAKHQLST